MFVRNSVLHNGLEFYCIVKDFSLSVALVPQYRVQRPGKGGGRET